MMHNVLDGQKPFPTSAMLASRAAGPVSFSSVLAIMLPNNVDAPFSLPAVMLNNVMMKLHMSLGPWPARISCVS